MASFFTDAIHGQQTTAQAQTIDGRTANTTRGYYANPMREPVPMEEQIPYITETHRDRQFDGYATILSAIGYLLYKKQIISDGDYQLLSEVEGHDMMEIVTRIIQIADAGTVE